MSQGIQVAFRSVEGTSALLFLGAKDTLVGAGGLSKQRHEFPLTSPRASRKECSPADTWMSAQ